MKNYVALYRYSTSNHNYYNAHARKGRLHYIVILHQTTTINYIDTRFFRLHYIVILHQTTTLQRYFGVR